MLSGVCCIQFLLVYINMGASSGSITTVAQQINANPEIHFFRSFGCRAYSVSGKEFLKKVGNKSAVFQWRNWRPGPFPTSHPRSTQLQSPRNITAIFFNTMIEGIQICISTTARFTKKSHWSHGNFFFSKKNLGFFGVQRWPSKNRGKKPKMDGENSGKSNQNR